ncbi:hypothetical protein POM88_054556 [Heracleum sosnowskyi]|uniref:Uncharacterized protein n=1 Tax=Heracleum sosnowskyi TaxID=360622 RepID=A0AAD8LUP4_9APIA|nr:hypothetical protein POM88_054556 [Heracleum sosnowskyi]
MCKCRSHGTFPLFGLQSSHLNICYYHQDPHQRPLHPGLRPRFRSDRSALLLIGAWHLPRRPGIGRALKRHPFSGLVDSAVSLRASTRVSSGFAPLRHSSPSFGSRQECSHSNPSQKIKVGRQCTPQGDPANQLPCALRVYSPVDSHTCQTPWSVFQDGPKGAPAGLCQEHADAKAHQKARAATTIDTTASPRAFLKLGLWPPRQLAQVHTPSRLADRLNTVPHPTGAHRRSPFASLPTISSTL